MTECPKTQAPGSRLEKKEVRSIGFLIYLSALSGLNALGTAIGFPAFPAMEAALNVPKGSGALTLTVFLAGFSIAPLICGPLSDRFGRRAIILTGLSALLVSSIGCAFAPSMTVMLFFRVIQGTGAGFSVVMPTAIIRDLLEGDIARSYQGQVNAILGFAPLLAPFLGNIIYISLGWRMIYAFLGVASLILLLYTIFRFKESLPLDRRQSIAPRTIGGNYLRLLTNPVYMSASLTYIFTFGAVFAFVSGSSLAFQEYFKMNSTTYSLIFFCTSSCMMIGAFLSAMLSRKGVTTYTQFNTGFTFILSSALTLFFWPWMGLTGIALIVAAASMNEFAFGLNTPNSIHEALTPVPDIVGSATGLMRSLQMGMASVASYFVVLLADANPQKSVFAIGTTMLACSLLSFSSYLFLRFKRRAGASGR